MNGRFRHPDAPDWLIPAVYALVAIVAAFTVPRIEIDLFPEHRAGPTPQAALAIYTTMGSGMLALTGIVFSFVLVMVQFSAFAYSPRLVRWIARDRVIWHSLGVFTATFLYSIAAIAWLDRNNFARVPFVSGWMEIGLLLASVGMFIALVGRITVLQVGKLLSTTGDHGRQVIESVYPLLDASAARINPDELGNTVVTQTLVHRGRPQAVQAFDQSSLLKLASDVKGIVVVVSPVGDMVFEGTPLLRILGGERVLNEELLRRTIKMGQERTAEQDPKYPIRLIVDIAIKALSPASNDPTTAVQALDQIEDLLLRLGKRKLEAGAIRDGGGALRVVMPGPSWEDFIVLSLDEIRFYGANSVQVMRRMKALASGLLAVLPEDRHPPLRWYKELLDATIARSFEDAEERKEASVEDRQGLGLSR